jgi:hypothetical protein
MGARVLPSPPLPARLVSLNEKVGAAGVGGAHSFHAPVAVCGLTSGSRWVHGSRVGSGWEAGSNRLAVCRSVERYTLAVHCCGTRHLRPLLQQRRPPGLPGTRSAAPPAGGCSW